MKKSMTNYNEKYENDDCDARKAIEAASDGSRVRALDGRRRRSVGVAPAAHAIIGCGLHRKPPLAHARSRVPVRAGARP